MSTLIIKNGSLKIDSSSGGYISVTFTTQMATMLLALPPDRNLCRYGQPAKLYAAEILNRLTADSLNSFYATCAKDPALLKQLTFKQQNYAVYANPKTMIWGFQYDPLLTLDIIPVGAAYISAVCWLITGRVLYLAPGSTDYVELTDVEFKEAYGMDAVDHLKTSLPLAIANCTRALNIIENCTLHRAVVSFIDKKKSAVDKKEMVFWHPEQLDMYLNRHDLDKLGSDPVDPNDGTSGARPT